MKTFVLASAAFLMLLPVAHADMQNQPAQAQDQIILNLQTEGWVTTNSAKVGVFFDITQQKETAAQLKNLVMESLKKLAPEPEWFITSSRENKDRTGLTRWAVSAEARVPEKSISGLSDRADSASRPGFKIRVGQVDFSPSLAETEKLRGDLRTQIYVEAMAEAGRLSAAIPGRKYRVFVVDFAQNGVYPRPQTMPMRSKNMAMQEMSVSSGANGSGGGAAQLAVSRRHHLSATVILSSAPVEKK